MRGFSLTQSKEKAHTSRRKASGRMRHPSLLTAPHMRREGEVRQNSGRDERNQGKNVCVERNQPLTRPAVADGNAAAGHPLPQGGEGIGSEAGPCQESGHCDRGFGWREQRTNAAPCPRPCSSLSAVVSRPLFSATFPVRSLLFSESAPRRGCPTQVGAREYAGTATRPSTGPSSRPTETRGRRRDHQFGAGHRLVQLGLRLNF